MENIFRICSLVICILALSCQVTFAEVKTFEAQGEYIMSELETTEIATAHAREYAKRAAAEIVGFYIKSQNNSLTDDEAITIAASILKIQDEIISKEVIGNARAIKITVKIKAVIDTEDISKLNK